MRSLVLVLAFASLLQLALAGNNDFVVDCKSSRETYTVPGTNGTLGCSSSSYSSQYSWTLTSNEARKLTFTSGALSVGASVTIRWEYITNTYDFHEAVVNHEMVFGPGDIVVSFSNAFNSDGSNFVVQVAPAPSVAPIVSNQPFNTHAELQGGWVYFRLSAQQFGKLLTAQVTFDNFQGLRAPGLFMSGNELPNLEVYGYTNTSVQSEGNKYTASIDVPSPTAGDWYLGVFLYGTVSDITIQANWVYDRVDVPWLENGVKVQSTTSNVMYYEAVVDVNTNSLNFQVSRQVPGGYIIVYILEGDVPSNNNYKYILDTRKSSYQTVTIDDPNPSGNSSPNPGVYVVAVESTGGSSGFILEAQWK